MTAPTAPHDTRLAHRLAVALAFVTFPLIWVGGLVTTYDAGMAVPDWPTTYGRNMFLYPWSTWWAAPWDLFIEHGHRLLGAAAGLVTIGLVWAVWKTDRRCWMLGAVLGALALVIAQGILGGLRVRGNSDFLARVHGCVGPLFFACTVALAGCTSSWWHAAGEVAGRERSGLEAGRLLASAWLLVALSYLQLVLGAHLRHPNILWEPRVMRVVVLMHVALAFWLLAHSAQLARAAWRVPAGSGVRRLGTLLGCLVPLQFAAGVAAWTMKYGWPQWLPAQTWFAGLIVQAESMRQSLIVTGHAALGSLILAAGAGLALRLTRWQATNHSRLADQAARNQAGESRADASARLSSPLAVGVPR